MSELHLPWLEVAVLIPLVGAIGSAGCNHNAMRIQSAVFSGITFLCTSEPGRISTGSMHRKPTIGGTFWRAWWVARFS